MNAKLSVVPPADPSEAQQSGLRPSWVTDDVIEQLTRWVSRDPIGGAEPIVGVAPFDLGTTAVIPASTADDVTAAVERGHHAQPGWAVTPFRRRQAVALAFHDLLMERQDQAIDLIQWETGKARLHAWQEVAQVATIARHYARKGAAYLSDNHVRGMVPGLTKVREVRVPRGVVGIISPWNYPLYLGVGDVLPALLAGNAVVSKADSQTALTLLWTRALMSEAGLPADLWQVVVGPGSVVGTALISAVDYICFTGSTQTGRRVGEQAGARLIGASLELGGKNPLIVREDADLAKAATGTVAASFTNTGQMCISIERVYVHESVRDAFVSELVKQTEALSLGQGFDYSYDVGCLTSESQLQAVRQHVDDAVAKGATVLTGGRPRPDLGPLYFEPTVLADVTPDMTVCGEETFGPVISVYPYKDDTDAVRLANQGNYGLSASIWSKSVRRADTLARRIRSGAVSINDGAAAAAGSIEAGMGGMGDSGLGRRHGAEGIRKYTESQTIAVQRLMALGVPANKTIAEFVEMSNKQLKLFRRLGLR